MGGSEFDRLTERFLSEVREAGGGLDAVCDACVKVLPVQRAAIVIEERDAGIQPWCASDRMAAHIETVQATVGEGPAIASLAAGEPVLVVDLAEDCRRWPTFADALARTLTSGAMLALPLRVGSARLGALDVYRATPGPLDASVVSAGMHIADRVAEYLVLATDEHRTDDAARWWEQPLANRTIHQAAGMVIAQLRIGAPDAYTRLRAYAVSHGLSLVEVAEQVVDRRISFDPGQ